jgi:hypothetical protein
MKSRRNHKLAITSIRAWWLANVVANARAFHYACAAQHDERNGFPYAAAMEWREAAELLVANTLPAEYCWRQWERIMHLSRRLAGPVSFSGTTAFPSTPAPSSLAAAEPGLLLAA